MPGGIHPPLEVIETWPKPNYAHPETKGWGLIIVSIVLGALSVVVVTLRMWCRLVISHNQGIDDYILLAAMVCLRRLRALSLFTDFVSDSVSWLGSGNLLGYGSISFSSHLPQYRLGLINTLAASEYGFSKHVWDIIPSELPRTRQVRFKSG